MEIKDIVKEKYGQAALRVTAGGGCCGASARRAKIAWPYFSFTISFGFPLPFRVDLFATAEQQRKPWKSKIS